MICSLYWKLQPSLTLSPLDWYSFLFSLHSELLAMKIRRSSTRTPSAKSPDPARGRRSVNKQKSDAQNAKYPEIRASGFLNPGAPRTLRMALRFAERP